MTDLIVLPSQPDDIGPHWTEVGYTLAPRLTAPGRMMAIAGKACGIRSDGNAFWAAYDLPFVYPENFDWTEKAMARLNTFLDCGCSMTTGVCSYHQMMSEEWTKEDDLRNTITAAEIPEALKGHVHPANRNTHILRPA